MSNSENKRGRPVAVTAKVLDKLEYAFSIGCSDKEACLHADIGESTLYDYQKAHPEFSERKGLLKEKPALMSRKVVFDALIDNDKQTATWYLERKKKAEFSTKEVKEIEGGTESTLLVKFEDNE